VVSVLEIAGEKALMLLEQGYLPFESGYMELEGGVFEVASLTRMPYCKKEMIEWWFAYGLSPQEHTHIYKLWHPVDHVYGCWDDKWSPGNYIGASHLVDETLGRKPPIYKLRIHFQDPSVIYDVSKFKTSNCMAIVANIYDRDGGRS